MTTRAQIMTIRTIAGGAAVQPCIIIDSAVYAAAQTRNGYSIVLQFKYMSGGEVVVGTSVVYLDDANLLMDLDGDRVVVDALVPLRRKADRSGTITATAHVEGPHSQPHAA